MCQWPRWNSVSILVDLRGYSSSAGCTARRRGLRGDADRARCDESDSFELSFGIEVLAAVGQVVLGIAPQRENGQEHVRVLGGKRVAGELGLAEMIALSASEAIQSSGDGVTRRTNLGVPAG